MKAVQLFGITVCAGDRQELVACLEDASRAGPKSMLFCNVHMLMLSQDDPALASAMASADLVFSDGVPVAWLQRKLGSGKADVLRGYEAVDLLCALASETGESVGFLGSTNNVLDSLTNYLKRTYPNLTVDFIHSPGAISEVIEIDPGLVKQINDKNLYCLFIGLGCPKQEKWVAEYKPQLNCNLLAVGAAFDWLAGTTPKPPDWMEAHGLIWLHRLLQNPGKMWHRYLFYNSKFIYRSARLMIQDKLITTRTRTP